MTTSNIYKKYRLPKIGVKKIDEANQFINNPSAALKSILARNLQRKGHNEEGESASMANLNNNGNSNTSRVNGHMKRSTTLELEESGTDRELISEKMKKYKPANGSFSQFYA